MSAMNWIAVASAEHVRHGRAEGFMQVCHGKASPLRRVLPGSRVACYSPTEHFGSKRPLRALTALGVVKDGVPYQCEMAGFRPFRRDVRWLATREVPIAPLLDQLEFARGVRHWGWKFRFGLVAVSAHDMDVIARAMSVRLS
jgi:hypothetical protein